MSPNDPVKEAELMPMAWMAPSDRFYKTRMMALANCEQMISPLYALTPDQVAALAAAPVKQPAPSAAAHVGDSLFESWFSEYNPAHRGTKQQMRDAYAAGMGDPKAQPSPTPQADSQPAPVRPLLPESLTLAVDRWFAENTGSGGCSDKDVRELAELFYGVAHAGGRESVDDALAIVESFGPGIGGLNDTYARQILLAEEVKRLRAARAPADSRPAGEVHGWVTMWPTPDGLHKPVYSPGKHKPSYGPELDAKLRVYPVFLSADSVLEDVARYQWIRGPVDESTRYSRWRIEYWDGPNGWQPMQRERMDSAIDAARKQRGA